MYNATSQSERICWEKWHCIFCWLYDQSDWINLLGKMVLLVWLTLWRRQSVRINLMAKMVLFACLSVGSRQSVLLNLIGNVVSLVCLALWRCQSILLNPLGEMVLLVCLAVWLRQSVRIIPLGNMVLLVCLSAWRRLLGLIRWERWSCLCRAKGKKLHKQQTLQILTGAARPSCSKQCQHFSQLFSVSHRLLLCQSPCVFCCLLLTL